MFNLIFIGGLFAMHPYYFYGHTMTCPYIVGRCMQRPYLLKFINMVDK